MTTTESPMRVDRMVRQGPGRTLVRGLVLPLAILVLCVVGTLLDGRFLTAQNISNVLVSMSIVGIIVVGMTFVFVTRGMADLSVPAMVAVGGILVLALEPVLGTLLAAIVGVLVATAAGAVNGVLIGYARLNPVITTLASGTIVLGVAQSFVGGVIVYGNDTVAQGFLTGRLLGVIPMIVVVFAFVVVVGHVVLSRSTLGRWTYAVGGNPHASRASAVPVSFARGSAFGLTAALSGLSGVLLGISLQTARPVIGTGYEFDAITAVVVGGVSLLGGSGTVLQAVGGLLFVQLLTNIMVLQGVPTEPQGMVKGALIIGAVAIDIVARRRGGKA